MFVQCPGVTWDAGVCPLALENIALDQAIPDRPAPLARLRPGALADQSRWGRVVRLAAIAIPRRAKAIRPLMI